VAQGLAGERLGEGLGGHWVQAYFLHVMLKAAGGHVDHVVADEKVILRASVPLPPPEPAAAPDA
jgi:histidine phosphotransferase ChpT